MKMRNSRLGQTAGLAADDVFAQFNKQPKTKARRRSLIDRPWIAEPLEARILLTTPPWLTSSSQASWNSSSHVLTVTGAATVDADPGTDEPIVEASGSSATVTIDPSSTDGTFVHLGGLSLSDGASATLVSLASGATEQNHYVLVIGQENAASAPLFAIDSTSKLDLRDNDLIVHNGVLSDVQADLAAGRNVAPGGHANGTWTGDGLTSSVAAANDATAGTEKYVLGSGLNSDLPAELAAWTVGGESEPLRDDGNDVLVKYTLNGDFNLDGKVSAADRNILLNNEDDTDGTPVDSFIDGDTNGDTFVDATDAAVRTQFNTDALTTSPAAPTALTAMLDTTNPSDQIDLAWTAPSTTPADYVLERSTNGTSFTDVFPAISGSATSYQDTGLSSATEYWYRLRAVYTNGSISPAPASAGVSTISTSAGVAVISAVWDYQDDPNRLIVTFNSNVSVSSDALQMENTTTGAELTNTDTVLNYDSSTHTATWSWPTAISKLGVTGVLPDGWWVATLDKDDISAVTGGQRLNTDLAVDCPILSGDATHTITLNSAGQQQLSVGLADYSLVLSNFNNSNAVFADGDFNYDGKVDIADYSALLANFNSTLTVPPTAPGQLVISNDSSAPETALDVTWSAPAGSGTVDHYRLESSSDGESFSILDDDIPASQLTYQATGLAPGTTVWYRVHAVYTNGSVSPYTAKHALTTLNPQVITPAAAVVSTDGRSIALTVQGADPVDEAGLTYTWADTLLPAGADTPTYSDNGDNSAKNTTATITGAGDYSFEVTIADSYGLSITSDVDVTVGQISATLSITPDGTTSPATVGAGEGQEFDVSGTDQFGAALDDPAVNWSVAGPGSSGGDPGTVNDEGFYNAPTDNSGTFTLTATSTVVSSLSATASVDVAATPPTVFSPATALVSASGTSIGLTVLGADDFGESNLVYTWTATQLPTATAAPTFSDNSDNSAKSTAAAITAAGDYSFQVTITDLSGDSTTSDATINVSQIRTRIQVLPNFGTQTLPTGAIGYRATELDQFGKAMTTQPTFTWSSSDPLLGIAVAQPNGNGVFDPDQINGVFNSSDPTNQNGTTADLTAAADGLTGTAPAIVQGARSWGLGQYPLGTEITTQYAGATFSSPDGPVEELSFPYDGELLGVNSATSDSDESQELDITFARPVHDLCLTPDDGETTFSSAVTVYTTSGSVSSADFDGSTRAGWESINLSAFDNITQVKIIMATIAGTQPRFGFSEFVFTPEQVILRGYHSGNNFGQVVSGSTQIEDNPSDYVVLVNDNYDQALSNCEPDDTATTAPIVDDSMKLNADGAPVDPDFGKLTLSIPYMLGYPNFASGALTLSSSDPTALQFFKGDGTELTNATLNFSNPSGDLQPINTQAGEGEMDVWFEGLKADPDVTISLTYTDTSGNVVSSDSIHVDLVDFTFVGSDGTPENGVANVGLSDLLGDATGDPDAAPILDSEKFKVSLQGLDESQVGQVLVQSTDDPQDDYVDDLTDSGSGLLSTNCAVLYDASESETISAAQRSEILANLGLNAVHNESATTTLTTASGLDSQARKQPLSASATLMARLNDMISRQKGASYYQTTGLAQLFRNMQAIVNSGFFTVRFAKPGELRNADATYTPGDHVMVIKPSLDAGTAVREIERAMDDQNGWHPGNSDAAYIAGTALEWGISYLLTNSVFLRQLDRLAPGPNAAAQATMLWNEAWSAQGLLGIYQEPVPLDNNQPGRLETSADLWDVNAKLGVHFSAGQLRPIYEQMLAAKGINVVGGLPAVNIPAGDALQ